jgi:hypothetical protein
VRTTRIGSLSLTDDGDVAFRISAKPYKHIKSVFNCDDPHPTSMFSGLRSRATGGRLGRQKPYSTTITPSYRSMSPTPSNPFEANRTHERSCVYMNEDNVAPTALSKDDVEDTLVIDFPEIKFERHRYFMM